MSISCTLAAAMAMATTSAGTGEGSEVVSVALRMWNVMVLDPEDKPLTSDICREGGRD